MRMISRFGGFIHIIIWWMYNCNLCTVRCRLSCSQFSSTYNVPTTRKNVSSCVFVFLRFKIQFVEFQFLTSVQNSIFYLSELQHYLTIKKKNTDARSRFYRATVLHVNQFQGQHFKQLSSRLYASGPVGRARIKLDLRMATYHIISYTCYKTNSNKSKHNACNSGPLLLNVPFPRS